MVEGQNDAINAAWTEMASFGRDGVYTSTHVDVVICESFTITTATAKKTRGGSNMTIEIIGALRWLAYKANVPFVTQAPGDAESFATNEKLKRLGWYTPGPDHARSAARHLLLYLMKNGHIDARKLLP